MRQLGYSTSPALRTQLQPYHPHRELEGSMPTDFPFDFSLPTPRQEALPTLHPSRPQLLHRIRILQSRLLPPKVSQKAQRLALELARHS